MTPSNPPPPETLDRLIDAAMRVFATSGFEGAATRDLARAANVALSAISYHFGTKAGLYRAAVQRAADLMAAPLQHRLADARALLDRNPDPVACVAELKRLVEAVAQVMLAPGHDSEVAARFSMRELVIGGSGFAVMNSMIVEPIVSCAAALLRVIEGAEQGERALMVRAMSLFGPLTLYRILHNQSLGAMTPMQDSDLQTDIGELTQLIIRSLTR